MEPDTRALLGQTRQRAQSLLDELLKQQAELRQASPGSLTARQLADGAASLDRAIDSLRRILRDLDDAIAGTSGSAASGNSEREVT